ncbi:hypothetical protein ACQPZP_06885 [Spirillospora sp. CA-142024]|uniref:hypothetical protein n=1 Tax=Spirillospora sp. CA-142024 TaxID=3240036 RepID=UPI003D8EB244
MGQLWNRDEILAGLASLGERGGLGAPWRLEQVLDLEGRYEVRLPESYRSFVLEVGDRVTAEALDDEIGDRHIDYDDLLTGSMIIADIGCGAFERLVVTGPAAGQVWREELRFGGGALTPGPDFGAWYLSWLRRVGAVKAPPGLRRRLVGWHSRTLIWHDPGSEQDR